MRPRRPGIATAEQAIEHAVRTFGGFHGLYHVAGGSGRRHGDGPLHELSDEGWQHTGPQVIVDCTPLPLKARARQFRDGARRAGIGDDALRAVFHDNGMRVLAGVLSPAPSARWRFRAVRW